MRIRAVNHLTAWSGVASGQTESEENPMLAKSLKEYLDERKVRYITIIHSPAYTAQEVAHSAHIPESGLAKTVMIIIDGALAMAVVPANRRVRLEELQRLTHSDDLRLAHEEEFKDYFPDCEPGAMPPFGNLYDMSVYVSPELAKEPEMVFNAGSHTELIRMGWLDYRALVKPCMAAFAA
ncbi:MAG: YbaK/EbsC family protein [Luteolibacter sp.]|uniref:aminoacyl-tRNA deacylase n=1 Tax=Luteolibacter sp. TaxID=1962973 RepID=UPI0032669E02